MNRLPNLQLKGSLILWSDPHTCVDICFSMEFSEDLSCQKPWEDSSRWLPNACLCCISSSQHHQSSSDICHKVSELVVCRAPWLSAGLCFLGCTTGNLSRSHHLLLYMYFYKSQVPVSKFFPSNADSYTNRCVCWLGLHFNQRHWMGLGRYRVAL